MKKPFHQDFPLTQGFGLNPGNYAKFNLKGHNGLDYGLPSGTDVIAPHAGKVIEVAYDGPGYGNYIKIENDKEGSVLAHLKDSLVSVGTIVTEGQLIAHSDNTGNSTGPHLHWGYYTFPRDRGNGYNGFINQLPLLQATESSVPSDLEEKLSQSNKDRDINWNCFIALCDALGVKVDPNNKEATKQAAVTKIQVLLKRPASCPPAADPRKEQALLAIQEIINNL